MKDKVDELRILSSDLDTLIYILFGGFKKTSLEGNGTVKEQIACYKTLGADIQSLITEILEEHGDDINPFSD
ncbi:hypothetical protein M087_1659 [Bacteroides fragilis str. S23 R14]|jgi:hypothetical protein|uniref:hypothetical protein n=1 Tax=Bacteroides fragilis TaxID=817 RepID=UPI0004534B57|nr:hypothetical protein [Bacteroides fragilis]EYA00752.1 hypothetical protein M087_1659 [Bacteroides fragilis str. S23 R14]MCS2588052.1 hypothetical protein [Bacteroides fragilis]